jgi:two-component system, chemotaxis family, sensor kinase CheA
MAEAFDRTEFISGYLAEVEEHLENANAQLLKLEQAVIKGEPQLRMTRELFRALHTIKGLSAMVGVEPVVELAHEIEALLRMRDQTATSLSADGVQLLFRGVRAIEVRVQAFAQQRTVEAAPSDLLEALHALQAASDDGPKVRGPLLELTPELLSKLTHADKEQLLQGIAAGARALRLEFAPSPEKAAAGLSITSLRERLGKVADIVKVVPQAVTKSASAPSGLTFVLLFLTRAEERELAVALGAELGALSPIASVEPPEETLLEPLELDDLDAGYLPESRAHDTIRVEVSRLDDALERLGALVVTRYRLERAVLEMRKQGVDVRSLELILGEHRRELSRLRGSLTLARMVSMKQLLERVPLLVRGMARDTGKLVQLHVDAGRAELDKAVADRVFPALVHLIRNAIDHAIESSEERKRLGKPEAGNITVRCFERAGNQLELSVSDDGAGIDRVRVAKKAGAAVPDDDRALLELITRPGLSTLDTANARSGRGMGMDIVKRVAVGLLGGELRLTTERDVGSTFTLRLPMSISIIDSFAFRCGPQTFVVPLAMIEEVVELAQASVVASPVVHGSPRAAKLLQRRGESIPLLALASLFTLEAKSGLASALIVRREGERFAFAVDQMLGQQEVVVRPLEDLLVKVPGVTGSTDLGDGRPTLVLDLWALTHVGDSTALGATAAKEARR